MIQGWQWNLSEHIFYLGWTSSQRKGRHCWKQTFSWSNGHYLTIAGQGEPFYWNSSPFHGLPNPLPIPLAHFSFLTHSSFIHCSLTLLSSIVIRLVEPLVQISPTLIYWRDLKIYEKTVQGTYLTPDVPLATWFPHRHSSHLLSSNP